MNFEPIWQLYAYKNRLSWNLIDAIFVLYLEILEIYAFNCFGRQQKNKDDKAEENGLGQSEIFLPQKVKFWDLFVEET